MTLDLCGGHWLSSPSARKINLLFGFEYKDKQMIYDQADFLCDEEDITLDQLRYKIFGPDGKAVIENEAYIELRKKIVDEFYDGKPDSCVMELTVTKLNIIKMLVIMQSSQDREFGRNMGDAKIRGLAKLQIHKTQVDLLGRSSLPYMEETKKMVEDEAAKRKMPHKYDVHDTVFKYWTNPKKSDEHGWYSVTILERKRKYKNKKGKFYKVKWDHPEWRDQTPFWTRENYLKREEDI